MGRIELVPGQINRSLSKVALPSADIPEGAGEAGDSDRSNRSYEPVVGVNNFYDPENDPRAEMVLSAVGLICIFILGAYLANYIDEERAKEQKRKQDSSNSEEHKQWMLFAPI